MLNGVGGRFVDLFKARGTLSNKHPLIVTIGILGLSRIIGRLSTT